MVNTICNILGIARRTYFHWQKSSDKAYAINLFNKYFTKEDLQEFIETGKISRIENNKDQELLNNEASKIYNHFISSLYQKDKSLLKLLLMVINNANENSINLNLNFIDLVFEAEGEKKDKIHLIKEFSKISQNSNILFFYSIKFMIQKRFENILYTFSENKKVSEGEELSFIINYMQFFLEIFLKKEYLKWKEYENDESIHLRDYHYDLDDEDVFDDDNDLELDDLNDENDLYGYDNFPLPTLDDLNNDYSNPSPPNKFNYIKFINSLKNYKAYLESLISENDTILIKFEIDEKEPISLIWKHNYVNID